MGQPIVIVDTITLQQERLKNADPLDLVSCEGCGGKRRYAAAVRPGPDDGPATCCPYCTSLYDSCAECGSTPITENDLGLCRECVAHIKSFESEGEQS